MSYFRKKFETRFLLFKKLFITVIFFLRLSGISSYDPNGLLRSSASSSKGWVQFSNKTSSQNQVTQEGNSAVAAISTEYFNGTSHQLINQEYDDDMSMEPETNKTKRSKAAIRWLASAVGIGGGSVSPTSETEPDMFGSQQEDSGSTTQAPGSGILSKLNPLNKVSSKVSLVTNTAGQIYQTIAGKVGLGGGGSGSEGESGSMGGSDTDESGDNNNGYPGMKDAMDDDESGAQQLLSNTFVMITVGTVVIVLSSSILLH